MEPVFESVGRYTADEFTEWVRQRETAGDLHHYELLCGRIVMTPPAGWPHGSIESRINTAIGAFVRERRLGEVFSSSQGFRFPSGDIVEPDTAFVSNARLAACNLAAGEFVRVVPDLIVEILSPSNRSHDLVDKREIYRTQGVREYWIVDPESERITVLIAEGEGFREHCVATGADSVRSSVLPALHLNARDAFPIRS